MRSYTDAEMQAIEDQMVAEVEAERQVALMGEVQDPLDSHEALQLGRLVLLAGLTSLGMVVLNILTRSMEGTDADVYATMLFVSIWSITTIIGSTFCTYSSMYQTWYMDPRWYKSHQ